MRYIVAFLVFGLLVSWSVLVHSYSRSTTDILRYSDLFKDCPSLQKLSVDSNKGWKALVRFYPASFIEEFSSAVASRATADSAPIVIDPRQINHLVEIYLRSHSLAACGHKETHETVGTLCSVSKGTEFFALYKDIMAAMYKGGAIDSRTFLYLLESEPADWSIDEPYFFMNDRIVSSSVSVNDGDVEAKRKALIKEGFQTASHWSYDEVRKAIVNSKNGERLSDIDKELGVSRGELRMTLSNCLVRPVFLLRNWDNESYASSLDGLIPFVVENIGRDLAISDINEIRDSLEVKPPVEDQVVMAVEPQIVAVVKPQVVAVVKPQVAKVVKAPVTVAIEGSVTVIETSTDAVKPKVSTVKKGDSFARAYGGSRFHMSWGN